METADIRRAFAHERDLTVAVEEELYLVDPASFALVHTGQELVRELDDPETFREEASPAQIEIVTPVCATSGEAGRQIAAGRARAIAALGGRARLAGIGAHPFARPWSEIAAGPRYAALLEEYQLGIRLGALAAGLHVHVGVAGHERALAAYHGLRPLAPLLVAMCANAPFIGGLDSGLATVRCALADALPRHGTGPAFETWDAFEDTIGWSVDSGALPSLGAHWWDCRLNVRTGTVEIRSPDAQASVGDVEAVAAVVHAAAAAACARYDADERVAPAESWRIDENRWRAARWGLGAQLVDETRRTLRPARELLSDLFERLEPAAARCGASAGLGAARAMLDRDTPAEQRSIAASDGLPGVVLSVADRTEEGLPATAG